MKKLLCLFAATLLFSCSGDDGDGGRPYLESILVMSQNDGELLFTYNSKKQLISLEQTAANVTFELEYEDDKLVDITCDNDDYPEYHFSYDGDVLSQFTQNDTDYDVEFDPAENRYSFIGMDMSIILNDDNDIAAFDVGGNNPQIIEITYDEEHKGAAYNMKGKYDFIIFYVLGAVPTVGHRPATSYATYEIENTYDRNDYISKASYMNDDEVVLTAIYTYKNL